VQAAQLYNHQEQKNHSGKAGIQEILQVLSESYVAQRDQVKGAEITFSEDLGLQASSSNG
jgi:hypothetical protein